MKIAAPEGRLQSHQTDMTFQTGVPDGHSSGSASTSRAVLARDRMADGSMADGSVAPVIFVVEDDRDVRELLQEFLEEQGVTAESFDSAESFLQSYRPRRAACLLLDLTLCGKMSGLQLLTQLKTEHQFLPVIVMSGSSSLKSAIEAMKSGAADFIQKPINCDDLLICIEGVLAHSCYSCRYCMLCIGATDKGRCLTARQEQIMNLILIGHPSKNIAADLGISQRTVENHRASIMMKTRAKSISELARMSLATRWRGIGECPPCFAARPFSLRGGDVGLNQPEVRPAN